MTCTAVPVHDPRTGQLLGVVNLSGDAGTAHPQTVALVRTAVRLAQADLWRQREIGLNRLRDLSGPLLARTRGPAALVDAEGWIAAVQGIALSGRIAVPREGEHCVIPGIGACEAEYVSGGWLVRGAPTGERAELRLRIDPDQSLAVVEGATTWSCALSPRHLQLLAMIINAGPSGTSAADLSRALFGDDQHDVTVRAEISRLRRRLGGILVTRPYRIARGVTAVSAPRIVPSTRSVPS